MADVRSRYRELSAVIRKSVVDNDCFGLRAVNELDPLGPGSLARLPTDKQVEEFLSWLDQQVSLGVLELVPAAGGGTQPWVKGHLTVSQAKGVQRGSVDLRAIGADIPLVSTASVIDVMGLPEMQSVLNREVLRTWRGLTGVSQEVQTQVARVLIDGLEVGQVPLELARAINDRVDKIGLTRAELIARTEIVRANNLGAVAEYVRAERTLGEPVLVQWLATKDNRVRDNHILRNGKVFTPEEGLELIGEPNCRCSLLPYLESLEGKPDTGAAKEFLDMGRQEAGKKSKVIRDKEGLRAPPGSAQPKPKRPKRIEGAPLEVVGPMGKDLEDAAGFFAEVQKGWNAVPAKWQNLFVDKGWALRVGNLMTDVRPDLKGKHPRGWGRGATWNWAEGLQQASRKEVVVTRFTRRKKVTRESRRIPHVTAHEMGHSVDFIGGTPLSSAKGFIDAYDLDVGRLTQEERRRFSYILQAGKAGREEAFAEMFSVVVGYNNMAAAYEKSFPTLFAYVKKEVL